VFALSSTEIVAIAIVVILAVLVVAVLLLLLRRLRERRAKLLGELRDRPEHIQDRAFNRIAMARREAEILTRQGADIARPRDLIAQAQGAFDVRNYDRAYELAQQAHEALVHSRLDGPLPASPPTAHVPAPAPASPELGSRVGPDAGSIPPPSSAPIPKNRAESQFQLRLLDQELDSAQAGPTGSTSVREATKLRTDAGRAFDRADYTDAFRLALKGRRAIGAQVESLPAAGPGTPVPDDGNGSRNGFDATRSAEQAASAERCPSCGYPTLAGDAFCRGCGEPRTPRICTKCGAARQPSDTFCGGCGTPFS